jgi:hypothetical protein
MNECEAFPDTLQLKAQVTLRKGSIASQPRRGTTFPFTFTPTDGYNVFREKIDAIITRQGVEMPSNYEVYIKPSKNAVQSSFVVLTDGNYEDSLRLRWSKITKADTIQFRREAPDTMNPTADCFVFDFFVYYTAPITQVIRRATADNINQAAAEIRRFESEYNVVFGPIQRAHLEVVNARRPVGTELSFPSDPTTLMAQQLDQQMSQSQREEDLEREEMDADVVEVEIFMFNQWVRVPIKRSSLRSALRLPQHDIFLEGLFTGTQRIPPIPHPENDIEDTDHQEDVHDAMDDELE